MKTQKKSFSVWNSKLYHENVCKKQESRTFFITFLRIAFELMKNSVCFKTVTKEEKKLNWKVVSFSIKNKTRSHLNFVFCAFWFKYSEFWISRSLSFSFCLKFSREKRRTRKEKVEPTRREKITVFRVSLWRKTKRCETNRQKKVAS